MRANPLFITLPPDFTGEVEADGSVETPRGLSTDKAAWPPPQNMPRNEPTCPRDVRQTCRLAVCLLVIVGFAAGAITCLVLTIVADSYTLDS